MFIQSSPPVRPEVQAITPQVVRLRRVLHQHPEPGFQEFRTAGIVAEHLEGLGLTVKRGVAQTGVVAVVEGAHPGPTLLLRADMDCLPVQEETGLAYASERPGFMHACGHDGHTAILLGVASVLVGLRERLHGRVKLVFQPAEEGPGGAEPMIAEGVLEDPKVDAAVGLHLWSHLPVGTVGVRPGPMMAAADAFSIRVRGQGGHAAAPHEAVDPVIVAAQLILAIQTIVSRSMDPEESAVVSVCRMRAGQATNVIPEEVELAGTARSFTPEVRALLRNRLEDLCRHLPAAFGGSARLDYQPGYPPLVNDPAVTELVTRACREVLPAECVGESHTMGGEDFAFFLQRVPGCYFFLGARNPEKSCDFPHHHPRFDVDEDAMPLGVEILVRVAERFLGPPADGGPA